MNRHIENQYGLTISKAIFIAANHERKSYCQQEKELYMSLPLSWHNNSWNI
tara:strand:+ start:422 stop:574 length:153 start_codon:yes stop_codon:yes gene_type:complete